MAEYNVITFDDDERNARSTVVDNRRPSMSMTSVGVGRRPVQGLVVPPSSRPTVIQTAGASPMRPYYPAPQPTVVYHQPASPMAGLAGMTVAELIELGAQLLAAIQPLPGAPTAQGDVETDVENLVIYQTALATHAKRDEQLRTLGSLLGRVLRK